MKLLPATRTIALLALSALALTACAGQADAAQSTSAQSDAVLLPAAEGDTAYPLTLDTEYGSSTLDERPQRIAVIGGLGDQESTLALDIAPVVTSDNDGYFWNDGTRLDEVETFIDPWADSFAFEKLLAAKPDLIVASTYGNLENDYERLSSIAPVLAVAPSGDFAWDWRELVRGVGEATDLSERAEQQIDETESRITQAAQDHPEFSGKTVGIVINRGQETGLQFVNIDGSPAEELLDELGFAKHPHVEELSSFDWGEISLENIGLVDADGLLIARHGGEGTVAEATTWLESNQLYQQLGAVQAGKVAFVDPNPETDGLDLAWAFAYPNVLANRWTVDQLTDAFADLY
ncbi:ABC transporter substrate-binding protein [Leucobacter musarum]|uniref:ABC transporter substrate-binding protein n=1 Tax=Leucobacter musarum TaxID=1930747 RepID=UPI0006A7BD01|nr:ABC transporter substrate-binding protein [Leucobacter musarum]